MNCFVKFLFSFSVFAASSGAFAGIMLMDEMLQPAAGAAQQQQQAQANQQAQGAVAQDNRSAASVEANNLRSQLRRTESDLATCRADLASVRESTDTSEAIRKK